MISVMILLGLHYSWGKKGYLSTVTFQLPNALTNSCKQDEETQGNSVSKQLPPSLNPVWEVNHSWFHENPAPLTTLHVKKKKKEKSHM